MEDIKDEKSLYQKAETIPSVINILGSSEIRDSSSNVIIDKVDASQPETFTLDEFRMIVLEFRSKDKDCILARVMTPDDVGEHFYNSYYIASEVNKLLFKYERDRRLLHRMRTRNPLNNQFIIGPVHYYKITNYEVDRALVQYYFNTKEESVISQDHRSFSAVFRPHRESARLNEEKSKDTFDVSRTTSTFLEEENPGKIIEEVNKGAIDLPTPQSENIVYNAKYYACDDDFLMRADVRDYFKLNSIEPDEEFLFDLDRTHNDIFALLENTSESADEDAVGWKRVLSTHFSVLMSLALMFLFLGANPIVALIILPIALVTVVSFLFCILYVMIFRRSSFGSLAVNSVEDV